MIFSANTLTEGDVVRSLGSVERAIRAAEAEVEALREAGDKEDTAAQKKLDELREEKTRLEQSSRLKSQQIESNKRETKKVKADIEEVKAPKIYRFQYNYFRLSNVKKNRTIIVKLKAILVETISHDINTNLPQFIK